MTTMRGTEFTRRFADRLREVRTAKGMSQEQLADVAGIHRTHISLIERNHRSVRLETLERLASALGVQPAELVPGTGRRTRAKRTSTHHPDKVRLDDLFPFIRRYQELATRHGINDIFQDNGGKLLQTLLILDMATCGGREGNDCKDADGNEYELKTVNVRLTKSFSTHHHLNPVILAKYRAVKAWYFSVYEGIELIEIYRMEPRELEPYFSKWHEKWSASRKDINNPKIPVQFIRDRGKLVYPLVSG